MEEEAQNFAGDPIPNTNTNTNTNTNPNPNPQDYAPSSWSGTLLGMNSGLCYLGSGLVLSDQG
jgi:hypothetical protein